jgi:hypothetical protein
MALISAKITPEKEKIKSEGIRCTKKAMLFVL